MNGAVRSLLAFSFLLVAATGGGCAGPQQPPGLPLLGDRLHTKPPSSDGVCRFDLSGDKEQPIFFVLGFLREYSGRSIVEEDDRVETLYVNEDGSRQRIRRQLEMIAKEQGLNAPIREEIEAGGAVTFRCRPLAERLNSCYRYQMTNGSAVQGRHGYVRLANASLTIDLFMKNGRGIGRGNGLPDEIFYRKRALSYLAGAWSRYRQGDDLVFANSKDKATLLAQLLTNLGCRRVSLESTFGTIPGANIVRFSPTDEVREWLAREF